MLFSTLFLGICAIFCAIFGPFIAEKIKRKWLAPILIIEFSQTHPYCHLTHWSDGSPVYYFRFIVVNEGKSQARFCEALLEEIWLTDSSGNFIQDENFSPVNLIWVGQYELRERLRMPKKFVNINPKRIVFCDIAHISHPQRAEKSVFYLEKNTQELKFFFDITDRFFSQRDCISPGKAKIKISIYSENAPKCEKYFHIEWSGNWKDQEPDMFREIVIS